MQQAARVMQELAEAKEVSIKVERDGVIKDVQVNLSQQ
jgi:type II secretory pathway component PulC